MMKLVNSHCVELNDSDWQDTSEVNQEVDFRDSDISLIERNDLWFSKRIRLMVELRWCMQMRSNCCKAVEEKLKYACS